MGPGDVEKRTPKYERHGTTCLFAAIDVATGSVLGKCSRRHRSKEFIAFLRLIDKSIDPELDVHIVLDNLATHKTESVAQWLAKHPRFSLHFIPTDSSWLNQVECLFSILTEKQLKRGVHRSVRAVEAAVYEFLSVHNEEAKPFKWVRTVDEILAGIARFCGKTLKRHGA